MLSLNPSLRDMVKVWKYESHNAPKMWLGLESIPIDHDGLRRTSWNRFSY